MLRLHYRYPAPLGLLLLLCACSGSVQTAIPLPNTGAVAPAASTRSIQLGPQATTVTLPVTAEIAGSLVFPAVSSPATVSLSASATAPAGVELDTRRRAQSGTLTVYEYITLVPATTITLPSIPSMKFNFPATTPLAGKSIYYGISDLNSQGGRISFDTQGPGTISGQTVSFAQVSTPLTLQAGHTYTFILYGTAVKAAGATKIYVTNILENYGNANPAGPVTTYNADGTQSTPTINDPQLLFPSDIAVDASGKIYVCSKLGPLATYTATGNPTTPLISYPPFPLCNVAIDSSGRIYKTNANPGNPGPGPAAISLLSIFTATGTEIGLPITAGLNDPSGVAVGPDGKVYVLNASFYPGDGKANITTYTAQGVQTTPTISGSLTDPRAIAIDTAGKIYVADSNTIKTFLADGKPSTPTITRGISDPTGVAVDAAGKIYVANFAAKNITTYNPDGTQTSPTIATDPKYNPLGIAVH